MDVWKTLPAASFPPPTHQALGNTSLQVLVPLVAWHADAPLVNESCVACGRSASLEVSLPAAMGPLSISICAPEAISVPFTRPLQQPGPYPPPAWPGAFVGADYTTQVRVAGEVGTHGTGAWVSSLQGQWRSRLSLVKQGSWVGRYGLDGYVLLGFDQPSMAPTNPFCGKVDEGDALQLLVRFCHILPFPLAFPATPLHRNVLLLQCTSPGATISTIRFASFGDGASGSCPSFKDRPCSAKTSLSVVEAACVGQHACSVTASNMAFGGDPCPGTSKSLTVVALCSSGGGIQPGVALPPVDRRSLPSYVASVTLQTPDLWGFCGTRMSWTNATADVRALQVRNETTGLV